MTLLAAGLLAALAGCATTKQGGTAGKPGQICTRERPIGSNIMETTCRDANANESERQRDEVQRMQRGGPKFDQ